jgi:hypothetical protein
MHCLLPRSRWLAGAAAAVLVAIGAAMPAFARVQSADRLRQGPPLKALVIEGAAVFSEKDVLWLLELRLGERLPGPPEEVAERLQDRYTRDGYTAAEVRAEYDADTGRLTLRVDEGRIDAVEFEGLRPELVDRFSSQLPIRPGDVYNRKAVDRGVQRLLAESHGALVVAHRGIDLTNRVGRRILVIPIEERHGRFSVSTSSEGREDFFSPVDGFSPGLSFEATRLDPVRFNHTVVGGYGSYKFGSDRVGYSLGLEQRLFQRPEVFVGAEVHDLTASDDLWRLTTGEQSSVALFFKNTFRDYYRRRGLQAFAAFRPHRNHEVVVSFRRDRHEALANETDYSFFRDSHVFRSNAPITGGAVRSVVFGYAFDGRGLADAGPGENFSTHLIRDLYRNNRRQTFGWRVDWTSEIAGHGLGGDQEFDRHILNGRAYVPLSPRQSVAARLMAGFGGGTLPLERRFAIGGIGSVHGYGFKEVAGQRMTLINAEYGLDLKGHRELGEPGSLRLLLFFDAGQVRKPVEGASTGWLTGAGFGLQTGPLRLEFGFRTHAIPKSRQILVRFSPTF